MSKNPNPNLFWSYARPVADSKKGDLVAFEYKGFRVVGRVQHVRKNGTRTVEITEADPGFERHMAQDISEGIWVDVRT
jgi:hypothetical protein